MDTKAQTATSGVRRYDGDWDGSIFVLTHHPDAEGTPC